MTTKEMMAALRDQVERAARKAAQQAAEEETMRLLMNILKSAGYTINNTRLQSGAILSFHVDKAILVDRGQGGIGFHVLAFYGNGIGESRRCSPEETGDHLEEILSDLAHHGRGGIAEKLQKSIV